MLEKFKCLSTLYWPFANWEISVSSAYSTVISSSYGKSNKGKVPMFTFLHSNTLRWENYKSDGILLNALKPTVKLVRFSRLDCDKNSRFLILFWSRYKSDNWGMLMFGKIAI